MYSLEEGTKALSGSFQEERSSSLPYQPAQQICPHASWAEHNNMTRSEVAEEVDRRRLDMRNYLNKAFAGGEARLVIPKVPPSLRN